MIGEMIFLAIRITSPIRIAIVHVSPIAPPIFPRNISFKEGASASAPSARRPSGVAPVRASAVWFSLVTGHVVM